MKDYKIKWVNFVYKVGLTIFLFWFMFKIMMIALNMFVISDGTDKLLWIIIIGMLGFGIKFRIPYFDEFVSVREE